MKLNYEFDKKKITSNKEENRNTLEKNLSPELAKNIDKKITEVIQYITNLYNKEDRIKEIFSTNKYPKSLKLLKSGKLEIELKLENYQPEPTKKFTMYGEGKEINNKTHIVDLDFSVRLYNSLRANDLKTFGDIIKTGEKEILKYKCFGKKCKAELREDIFTWAPDKYEDYIGGFEE